MIYVPSKGILLNFLKLEPLIKKFESIGDPQKFYSDNVDDMGNHNGEFPVSEKEIQLAVKKYNMIREVLKGYIIESMPLTEMFQFKIDANEVVCITRKSIYGVQGQEV